MNLLVTGVSILALCILLSGCSSLSSPLPLTDQAQKPLKTIVYVGRGEAYRFDQGSWQRLPSYDYEFTVLQRFHEEGWESVKEIHRRHPDYDGRAGSRDQTLYFGVTSSPAADGSARLLLESSWGRGEGHADDGLKNVVVEFSPDISRFAPYNTFRITQHFRRQEGRLSETVEVFKKKDGKEIPFMKMEEAADIFMPVKQ